MMTKEELEKEAEECMHNALFWLKLPISKENVEQGGSYILKLLEPREKCIADLENENAELKEKYAKNITDCDICDTYCNSQLTKAKEIIEGLMRFCRCFAQHHTEDIRYKEAEQFLKEMEGCSNSMHIK